MDRLPIDDVLPALMAALETSPRVVLEAPTGAGKTTRVPRALLNAPWAQGGRIVMLEPRRLAAKAAARRMASELGQVVGETVGYRVRFEKAIGPKTRIEVVTDGLFTRMIAEDPALDGIAAVIFDEFHERSLDGDLGLAFALETAGALREDLRLLVMSATLDGEAVAGLLGGAPIVRSQGRLFPVELRYLERGEAGPLPDLAARAVVRALARDPGDILVFLPGRAEIERTAAALGSLRGVDIRPLHGELTLDAQDLAIHPATPGKRKVVLATNIAETSLTIEGIGVVIDGGFTRVARVDPGAGLTRLETLRVSLSSAEQRRGRAGRLGPGLCYRLWPEPETRGLLPQTPPEILRADLVPVAFHLAQWGRCDPDPLALLDRPSAGAFAGAKALLQTLEVIDDIGRLTPHGRAVAHLGAHPRLGHMMVKAQEGGLGVMAARIAALLEGRDVLLRDGARGVDLRDRLGVLAGHGRGNQAALVQARNAARNWARRLGGDPKDLVDDGSLGALVALAYPERIARRRGNSDGRYLMANGQGVALDPSDPLAAHEWLAVATLDGRPGGGVYLAAALDKNEIETLFAPRITSEAAINVDPATGAVRARRRRCLDAIVLGEDPWPDAPAEALHAAFLDMIRARGLDVLPWNEGARQFLARVRFARAEAPGTGWPDWSEETLRATLGDWLGPHLDGTTRLDALARLDIQTILEGLLPWAERQQLDRFAPATLTVPSGNRHRLDYRLGAAPILAVKLQEMFGAVESPKVADGKVPVTLHLLSPAGRPVQVTCDLARFWAGSYAAVRADLRGRYPKHPWPDNPLTAMATAKTKRAMARN